MALMRAGIKTLLPERLVLKKDDGWRARLGAHYRGVRYEPAPTVITGCMADMTGQYVRVRRSGL